MAYWVMVNLGSLFLGLKKGGFCFILYVSNPQFPVDF
jgi:hypothetical protein